jgi:FKBP-type peptidyl-prolyl cis-trans isomerase FklB
MQKQQDYSLQDALGVDWGLHQPATRNLYSLYLTLSGELNSMKSHHQLACLVLSAALGSTMAWAIGAEELPQNGTGGNGPTAALSGEVTSEAEAVDVQHYSYAIGMEIGSNFHKDQIALNFDSLMAGLKDAIAGVKPKYDQQTCLRALQQLSQQRMNKMVDRNKQYLEENKRDSEVKLTSSGLQYRVLKQGTGATPKASDTVSTHYRGTLIDGTEFDSSYSRGQPATFPVGGVIPGWTEALQLMKVGDKWQLVIPSKLAYGARGAGDLIVPHSTLIFEIELLGIEKQ